MRKAAYLQRIQGQNDGAPHSWPITPPEVLAKRRDEEDFRRVFAEWRELNPCASVEQTEAAKERIRKELA